MRKKTEAQYKSLENFSAFTFHYNKSKVSKLTINILYNYQSRLLPSFEKKNVCSTKKSKGLKGKVLLQHAIILWKTFLEFVGCENNLNFRPVHDRLIKSRSGKTLDNIRIELR